MRSLLLAAPAALAGFPTSAAALAPPPQGTFPPCLVQELRSTPDDVQHGDAFGASAALDGERAIVGAWAQDAQGMSSGAAYTYVRSGGAWTLDEKLLGAIASGGARFGRDVDLQGDTAVVGAPGVTGAGMVHVFEREPGGWVERTVLEHGQPSWVSGFATYVAMRDDVLVVGSNEAAFVYTETGAVWSAPQRIDPPAGTPIGTFFGNAVATDGERVAVGAPDYTDWAPGWVEVLVRQGTRWKREAKLETSGPFEDGFGNSVAIDGDTLMVGAPRYDGALPRTGYVDVYERGPQGWELQAVLEPDDLTEIASFGAEIELRGDVAVISAPGHGFSTGRYGAVYVFHRVNGVWLEHAMLQPPGPEVFREFGQGLGLSGDTILVGESLAVDEGGIAHVFAPPAPIGARHCACSAGPCGNDHPAAGCANSTGAGARLDALGTTDPDQLVLEVAQAPPGQLALFLEGRNAIELPFGDGFRCAGGDVVRLHAPRPIAPDGTIAFGPCHGDPMISAVTGVAPGSGEERSYQLWYRDPQGPCSAGFNLSDAVRVSW